MTIVSLTPEQEELIKQKVEAGLYSSPDELFAAALRLLDERDKKLAALRKDIQLGLDQLARGEYTEYTSETLWSLFEKIEAEGLRRLEARRQRAD